MADTFASRVLDSWATKPEITNGNIFTQKRQEGETDLVSCCREMLVSAGLMANMTAFETNQYIIDAMPLGEKAQRFLLNNFWRMQLISIEADTQKERFMLLDTGEIGDWIRCFQEGVLPTLVQHRLPIVI